jgi:hypothetical protein
VLFSAPVMIRSKWPLAAALLAVLTLALGGCKGHKKVPWVDECSPACAAGEVCWAGTCQPEAACAEPLHACPFTDGAMGCTDPRTDPYNCGGCGLQCMGGSCLDGVCRGSGNTCAGAGLSECVDADGHTHCAFLENDPLDCGACGTACDVAAGEVCAKSACQAAGSTCEQLELATCPSGCADLLTDPYNCGECGNVCMFGCDGLGTCR